MGNLNGKLTLVVDDEPENIDYISAILDDHQMKITSANNGKEALKKVKEKTPDIILFDLMMPEQSGMGFFNKFKENEQYKNIPVIIVSGTSKVTALT